MKYLSFEQSENPICEIKDNNKFKKSKIIYLESDGEVNSGFNHFKIDDGRLQLLPNKNIERSILYVAGQSGSGKTWFCKEYLLEYQKIFPKNEIYMFSTVSDDPSLKEVKISYIDVSSIVDDDLDSSDFKDSMVLFDDIENISEKKVKNAVTKVLNHILVTGRHFNTSCIITNHNLYNGIHTKLQLNESSSITYFPVTAGSKQIKYLLDNYLGLSKEEIQKISKIKSRSITILKSYPKIVLANKETFVLGNIQDSGTDSDSEIEEYFKKMKVATKKNKKK